MTRQAMTPRRLDWLLRASGTDLSAWPAGDRAAALALVRLDPTARAMLADALAREDASPADPAALARMQCGLRRCLLQLPPLPFGLRWGALAACTAAGLYFGIAGVPSDPGPDAGDPFAAVQSVTVASSL